MGILSKLLTYTRSMEIKFNPLRKLPSGKIAVASYMQWRKIKVADRRGLILLLDPAYKDFDDSALVFNHKGINLFWRNYDPETIPLMSDYRLQNGERVPHPEMWKTDYGMFSGWGLDCDGVPTFSHHTPDHVWDRVKMKDFEPLTVDIVKWWVGWFIYQLENTEIK